MAQRRARTADRDKAVEIVNNAYAEGQLDDAERSTRVTKALKARTLAQLDRLTLDLQQPLPPPGRPAQSAPAPTYREQFRKNAAKQREEWRHVPRWQKVLIGAFVVLCVGGLGVAMVLDDGPDDYVSVTGVEGTLALTEKGMAAFLATYEDEFNTTRVVSATFETDNVLLRVPTEDGKARHVEWRYRGGEFKQQADARRNAEEQGPIDLADIDLRQLEANIVEAKATLNVEEPDTVTVWVEREYSNGEPSVRIQVSNKYQETGMLITDLAGQQVLDRLPFASAQIS